MFKLDISNVSAKISADPIEFRSCMTVLLHDLARKGMKKYIHQGIIQNLPSFSLTVGDIVCIKLHNI